MKDVLEPDGDADAAYETVGLIDHTLPRRHETHRADFASLVPLAERVELVHADDPDAPSALARALASLAGQIEDRMTKPEMILLPVMRAGGGPDIADLVASTRADHEDPAGIIASIRQIADNLTPPEHACGSSRSLYGRIAALLDDLAARNALENDVLSPRFEKE